MKKKICKLPHLKICGIFFLMVLFFLSACAKDNRESSNQMSALTTSDEYLPVNSEQSTDTTGDKKSVSIKPEKLGPFSEKPQGMEMYNAVLQDAAKFYSTFDQEELTLEQFTQSCNGGEQAGATVSEFAVVDLDSDGQMEVILQLANSIGPFMYEILRCQGDIVYGYSLSYRTFMDLKSDGSFYFSSGVTNYGFGTIQFDDETFTIIELARTEAQYDESLNYIISYFVDSEEVSEHAYNNKLSSLCHTEARWYSFTEDMLNQIFAK